MQAGLLLEEAAAAAGQVGFFLEAFAVLAPLLSGISCIVLPNFHH